jgi:hypothetical protein
MYDRDALLAAVDLRALADDLLGPARTSGRTRMWPCPNSQHAQTGRTPPVSIFTSRRGDQRWRCHGCGDGGTAIDLVLACRGGSPRDALTYLAESAGQREQLDNWRPARRPERAQSLPPVGCRDPEGLGRYVHECAERLWKPEGRALRRWLMNIRRLPRDVLLKNHVGADLGPRAQARPNGMPRGAGVVLPVLHDGRAVYAQLSAPNPQPDQSRYLNPTSDFATNPRVARVRPVEARHSEVVVTEGTIDALSAAAAGYRAVAVLSAAYGDEAVAIALARLPHLLIIAFDADDAGRAGADRLASLLQARQRPPVVVDLGDGDLNDAMRRSNDWPRELHVAVDRALRNRGHDLVVGP